MKVLHLVAIEKFLPHIVEVSEAVNPSGNRYVAINAVGHQTYARDLDVPCELQPARLEITDSVLDGIAWCDAIFVHYLHRDFARLIAKHGQGRMIVWCGLGADYYRFAPHYKSRMFLPATLRRIRPEAETGAKAEPASGSEAIAHGEYFLRIARHIDAFAILEDDIDLQQIVPDFRPRRLGYFGYFSYERSFAAGPAKVTGRDILVGNSATRTCNHIDTFNQLRRIDLTNRRLVVPLSYGERPCIEEVANAARRKFSPDAVTLLRDWMPIERYNATISACSVAIMNHVRGQALGNICALLVMGSKVFMRPENPYVPYLRRMGIAVSMVPDRLFEEADFEPLSDVERARNADGIRAYWNFRTVAERTARLFQTVEDQLWTAGPRRGRRPVLPRDSAA